jgi:hypothetical protein
MQFASLNEAFTIPKSNIISQFANVINPPQNDNIIIQPTRPILNEFSKKSDESIKYSDQTQQGNIVESFTQCDHYRFCNTCKMKNDNTLLVILFILLFLWALYK